MPFGQEPDLICKTNIVVGVGRDRARYLAARLSIPPVATVRATFTAHGDPRRGFPAFGFR